MRYPDLSDSKLLCIDIETKDPLIKEKGNGVYRKDGYILGVAISNGRFSEYYNLGHDDCKLEERAMNEKYLREVLALPCDKLGTNVLYDIDWLKNYAGYEVRGRWHDIIVAESLINEYRASYSLEALAETYLGEHKRNRELYEYCLRNDLPVGRLGQERKWLWKMSYKLVRPYAIGDVELPIRIFEKQMLLICKEHLFKRNGKWEPETLEKIYDIEVRAQPMLLYMKNNGVRVAKDKLIYTGIQCQDIIYDLQSELDGLSGIENFNPNSRPNMEALFKQHDIPINYNQPTDNMIAKGIKKGNATFKKEILLPLEDKHPIVKKVLEYRHYATIMSLFVKPYPGLLVGDRLHCNFHPTKRDEGGTVTGRLSSANPNLQQVSGKKENNANEFLRGKVIRKCFIPEEGGLWKKDDWSQIEYRLISHYAIGPGSDDIRYKYNSDPKTDYHILTGHMSGLITDDEDEDQRKVTKTLNFGTAYGMGPKTMASKYGWDLEYAYMVSNLYHKMLPFVKKTSRAVAAMAEMRGFIKTLLGRHCHVPPSKKYYVMFNRLIQGSAADIMKMAMVQTYEAGIYGKDTLVPHLTVHDELDSTMYPTRAGVEAGREQTRIMETCVKLKVPIKSDSELGINWGELQPFEEKVKELGL